MNSPRWRSCGLRPERNSPLIWRITAAALGRRCPAAGRKPPENGSSGIGSRWPTFRLRPSRPVISPQVPERRRTRDYYPVPVTRSHRDIRLCGHVDRVVMGSGGKVIARHPHRCEREGMDFGPIHQLPLIGIRMHALDQAASPADWDLPPGTSTASKSRRSPGSTGCRCRGWRGAGGWSQKRVTGRADQGANRYPQGGPARQGADQRTVPSGLPRPLPP